jgi:nitroreductase
MSETIKTILGRRSVRKFLPEQIAETELETILQAGRYAPSGMNGQPWHFSVVQNGALLSRINEATRTMMMKSGIPAMKERAQAPGFCVYYQAPTLIVLSGDPRSITYQFDCTLALGTMFLAAESLEIGSCWIYGAAAALAAEENRGLARELAVPEGFVVQVCGAFGYPDGRSQPAAPRREGTVSYLR